MDVVYVVRDGEKNESLKYSLRSLKNLPHENVYIIGHKPAWVKNVKHINRIQRGHNKFQNISRNMWLASKTESISDDFIYMDDDYFIMREIDEIYPHHRGDIQLMINFNEEQGSRIYVKGYTDTRDRLLALGHTRPLSYELHIPMVFNKDKLRHVLELDDEHALNAEIFHVRSFYGNYYHIGGQHMNDVKIRHAYQNRLDWLLGKRYLSSAGDAPSGFLLKHLKELFPEKSQYE
jgi:hypothetical protein